MSTVTIKGNKNTPTGSFVDNVWGKNRVKNVMKFKKTPIKQKKNSKKAKAKIRKQEMQLIKNLKNTSSKLKKPNTKPLKRLYGYIKNRLISFKQARKFDDFMSLTLGIVGIFVLAFTFVGLVTVIKEHPKGPETVSLFVVICLVIVAEKWRK